MLHNKVKIGLVPMRRNTTNRPAGTFLTWVSAEERGHRFVEYIQQNFTSEEVEFVDIKGIGWHDLMFDDDSAAADVAKALGKPVLLWAPLDDEYYADGMRPTDSQCGLFAVSRQMQRFGIPFSHIPCCRVESDEFEEEFPYGYHTTVSTPAYSTYFLWLMAGEYQGFNRSMDSEHARVAELEKREVRL